MEQAQPNKTLANIALDLEQLASRAEQLVPGMPADQAHALNEELSAIRGLIEQATSRLRVVQAAYPEQLEAAR